MDDLHIAHLVLVTASAADGGCLPCIQQCIDEAMHLYPDLPFEAALETIRPESTREELGKAVRSSRALLESQRFPEVAAATRAS